MLADEIYHAHVLRARPDGTVTRHPAGRFMVKGGQLSHLEDYHGLLSDTIPEGAVDDYTVLRVNSPGPHLSVAGRREIAEGRRLDFVTDHPLPKMLPDPVQVTPAAANGAPPPRPQMPAVWHYHRVGHDKPHLLEAHGGKYLLDGNPLQDDEISTVLDNVRGRTAKIRYVKPVAPQVPTAIAKMEQVFADLKKADIDPQEALAHLDTLGGDEKTSASIASLRKHLFEDPMNPGVGNKYAYQEFRKKNLPGVYASIDVNNLKHLNDTQGHDAGDALIRAFGTAARTAADPAKTKLFRAGGDEYVLHAPDADTAYQTLRALREHVNQIVPVNGVHKPSFSAGLGSTFEDADRALFQAKGAKAAHLTTGGQLHAVPHFAHSLLPGAEGPVPLDPDVAQAAPPELPAAPDAEKAA